MEKTRVIEILKQNGLELGEELAIVAVKSVFKALPQIIEESENKYDDMLKPLLELVLPAILNLCDKIDGKVD